MPEELATILIDDIDYNYNKVKCRAIEHMMPKLLSTITMIFWVQGYEKKRKTRYFT